MGCCSGRCVLIFLCCVQLVRWFFYDAYKWSLLLQTSLCYREEKLQISCLWSPFIQWCSTFVSSFYDHQHWFKDFEKFIVNISNTLSELYFNQTYFWFPWGVKCSNNSKIIKEKQKSWGLSRSAWRHRVIPETHFSLRCEFRGSN